MPRLAFWNKKKQNDWKFFDRTIAEMFRIGGTAFLVHKYIGPIKQGESEDLTKPTIIDPLETTIQDLLLLENRDRKYDNDIYELRGVYNVQDNDFDLSQFGLFLSADTLFVSFHISDMIDIMGRKLMSGDVIELPHLLDDTLLSQDPDEDFGPVIPKLYKIEDANRASEGFSPTWFPHIWRVKVSPLTDSQEYREILDKNAASFNDSGLVDPDDPGTTLRDLVSTFADELNISESVIAEAERQVPNRNLEHTHLYVFEENESGLPYLFMTDGEPPNGAALLGSGTQFPDNPPEGAWFLRTDFEPNVLYKREGPKWLRKEVDFRKKWQTANRTLERFINNRGKTRTSGGIIDSKVGVSKIIPHRNHPKPDIE